MFRIQLLSRRPAAIAVGMIQRAVRGEAALNVAIEADEKPVIALAA